LLAGEPQQAKQRADLVEAGPNYMNISISDKFFQDILWNVIHQDYIKYTSHHTTTELKEDY